MIAPRLPDNEVERQKALESYHVLDTLPEEDYDDITRMAAMICGTPIAMISLIDNDRQFFKSKLGIEMSESPRAYSFCGHAINDPGRLMVVPDLTQDVRFSDNPVVAGGPQVKFYAGMPLLTPNGYALGTICVVNFEAGELTEQQQLALKSLANQVINVLELRKSNRLLQSSAVKIATQAREMEEFASVASHDLKEPLRMIYSFMSLLEKKYSNVLDEKGREYVRYAIDGAKRMTHLTSELLEFAKSGSDNTPFEPVKMQVLIEEVVLFYAPIIKEIHAELIFENLPEIIGQRTALKLLLQNLVSNAVKYRYPERQLLVEITADEKNDHWLFGVKDNGSGIPQDQKENIFQIFKRLPQAAGTAGAGLGLSICKKIIARHGGEIWAEPAIPHGSTLFFTILK